MSFNVGKVVFSALISTVVIFGFTASCFAGEHVAGDVVAPSGTKGGYCQIATYSYPPANASYSTVAYTGIAGDASATYYVQVGWTRGGDNVTTTNYFFEWRSGSSDTYHRIRNTYGPAVGSKHAYKVEQSSSDSYTFIGSEDGAQIGSIKLNWNSVHHLEYAGERHGDSSYFPGKVSLHDYIDCPQYKDSTGWHAFQSMSQWTQDTYGGLNNTTYFNSSNNYRFDIWDTRIN